MSCKIEIKMESEISTMGACIAQCIGRIVDGSPTKLDFSDFQPSMDKLVGIKLSKQVQLRKATYIKSKKTFVWERTCCGDYVSKAEMKKSIVDNRDLTCGCFLEYIQQKFGSYTVESTGEKYESDPYSILTITAGK